MSTADWRTDFCAEVEPEVVCKGSFWLKFYK